jgi:hypothetical protein
MTVANERGLNPKFKGASNEELLAELAARRAVLVSAMSAELSVWSQIASPQPAAAPRPTPATPPAAVSSAPKATKASPAKPKRRKRKATSKAQRSTSAPTGNGGNPRAKSASGKTSSEYAVEVLAKTKGALSPKDVAPRMQKAGWHTDSPDPAAVVATTLKKLAAEGKVKKTEGRNEFRALRSSP